MTKTEVEVAGDKYTLIIDDEGNAKLRTYDEEYKMWVNIHLPKEHNQELENELLEILKKDFIEEKIRELSN